MTSDNAIETWAEWPADVVATLRAWNKERRLSFPYSDGFVCSVCERSCQRNLWGDARLDGEWVCDECLIEVARYANGRKGKAKA